MYIRAAWRLSTGDVEKPGCVVDVTVLQQSTPEFQFGLTKPHSTATNIAVEKMVLTYINFQFEGVSMFEFVIAIIALSSASIFAAHAVDGYLTR
jgi:hypothetical protein